MKKYLLSQDGNFYKANMHCHTNNSDGGYSPEEVKKMYLEKGYSIVAFTDHEVLLDRSHLCDENFVALNGVELAIVNTDNIYKYAKKFHFCAIALDSDNLIQPCWHRSKYLFSNAVNFRDAVKFDENESDFERVYCPECANEMMKTFRDKGFFVTYNHPTWSQENYLDYSGYNNMHAMEIANYTCWALGHLDYNEKEYDDMLRAGKRIYCIAGDDNHKDPNGFFGAWTMIKADKLDYKSVTNALAEGNFYSSMGPEIYDLYFEDGKLNINCSDARRIVMRTGVRRNEVKLADKGGAVNSASFNVEPTDIYVRISVEGFDGFCAATNAYFVDELLKD